QKKGVFFDGAVRRRKKTTVAKSARSLKKTSAPLSASVIFAGAARKNHKKLPLCVLASPTGPFV
ncbi:MAG: hypothetical protein JW892_17630, partial [Anaerolineae bacterium]|nr:hypothetical protein [Anaerolineae bacterium]